MESEPLENARSWRRAGQSLRRFELRWPGGRAWALTGDGWPRSRARPLEFDRHGLPIAQPPLTLAERRYGSRTSARSNRR
jgi:hypothetical protein